MHITTKDVVADQKTADSLGLPVGSHVLTNTFEADGATALCSEKANLIAKTLDVSRTASGGIKVVTAVEVSEPIEAPTPVVAELTDLEKVTAYLETKGLDEQQIAEHIKKFGIPMILTFWQQENDAKQASLAKELAASLKGK